MNNFLKNYLEILKQKNFNNPDIELRYILNKACKTNDEIILSNFNIDKIDLSLFKSAFKRRINNEPLAKIFNEKNFWKYNFYVNKNVLDPRPETELLIETVEKYFKNKKEKLKFADLGTGSGCLAISLAKEYRNSQFIATDISSSALFVAKKNSFTLGVAERIEFICCDWINFKNVFDIIVTNPPYLTDKEYKNLNHQIKKYEPSISLKGGKNGLVHYKKIASKIAKNIHKKTLIFAEIGYNQKKDCIKIFHDFGLKCIDIVKDYSDCERILVFKKKLNNH